MKKSKEATFALETDLCAAFIASLPEGWVAYPETANWDILLVRTEDGFQIGVQAKLKFNTDVLTQTLERYSYQYKHGPDVRAVLVPGYEDGLETICSYLGIAVIKVLLVKAWDTQARKPGTRYRIVPGLPKLNDRLQDYRWDWPEWAPLKRETLPDYVPDVKAGDKAPLKLTLWKIAAIKISILLERQGFLTKADFKALDMDTRRWLPSGMGWLKIDPTQRGRYFKAEHYPDFKRQHPRNYSEIEADFEKWAPKAA